MSKSLDIHIVQLISSSKSIMTYESIYKEYGTVIDGMCENLTSHYYDHTIMNFCWTKKKLIALHFFFIFFFNIFYLVQMKNKSLARNKFKWNVKSHQNVHKVPQNWDVTYDIAFSIESIFKFCFDQPLTSCQPVS